MDSDLIPLIRRYKYLSLSSKIDCFNELIIGKWFVCDSFDLRRFHNQVITFNQDGTFKYSYNKKYSDYIDGKELSYIEPEEKIETGRYVLNKDNFLEIKNVYDIKITYIDEHIILGGKDAIILIKESSLDLFTSNDDILNYFSKIENEWEMDTYRIRDLTYDNYDKYIYNGDWTLPVLIGAIIIYILLHVFAHIPSVFPLFILVFILSGLISTALFFPLFFCLRNRFIKKYKKEHPEDKLANIKSTNPFKFRWDKYS